MSFCLIIVLLIPDGCRTFEFHRILITHIKASFNTICVTAKKHSEILALACSPEWSVNHFRQRCTVHMRNDIVNIYFFGQIARQAQGIADNLHI